MPRLSCGHPFILPVNAAFLLPLLLVLAPGASSNADLSTEPGITRDYCQFESFNATCPRGSVILMKTARYGRMRVGRCVRGDYGYIGCAASVLRNLDQRCSGRRECWVDIPGLDEMAKPCPEDFKAYLEANYECVQVATGTPRDCRENHQVTLEARTYGYLASFVTERAQYGSASCPWTLRAQPGQRLRLRFYNFLPVTTENVDPRDDESAIGCPLFAVIREGERTIEMNLCEQTEREGNLITSDGPQITVFFSSPRKAQRVPKFMLQYRALGCPDIRSSQSALVRRSGDNAMIRCNQTQETWYVTCKENRWMGDIGNCSKRAQGWRTGNLSSDPSVPHGIVMAVVIGILLGVVIGTILLAVVFTCRRRHRLMTLGKKDPLSILKNSERGHHRHSAISEAAKESYKFSRENSKNSKTADYSFRQQSRPLISRPEVEFRNATEVVVTSASGSMVSQSQHQSRGGGGGVSDPPPYCPKNWNSSDGGCGSAVHASSRIHDYESPKPMRRVYRDAGRDPRSSLSPLAPGDPPVYFELDPEGNNNGGSPTSGVGTHGSMTALGPDDDVMELR